MPTSTQYPHLRFTRVEDYQPLAKMNFDVSLGPDNSRTRKLEIHLEVYGVNEMDLSEGEHQIWGMKSCGGLPLI